MPLLCDVSNRMFFRFMTCVAHWCRIHATHVDGCEPFKVGFNAERDSVVTLAAALPIAITTSTERSVRVRCLTQALQLMCVKRMEAHNSLARCLLPVTMPAKPRTLGDRRSPMGALTSLRTAMDGAR